MNQLIKIYEKTITAIRKYPFIFFPFLLYALLQAIALVIIYIAPRDPFNKILAPPIRTFWGERFLHYPTNFILLPKLFSIAQFGLAVIIGSLITGLVVALVLNIFDKRKPGLRQGLFTAVKRYIPLILITFLVLALFRFSTKFIVFLLTKYFLAGHERLLFLGGRLWFGPLLLLTNFACAILIQALFIYSIPVLIIERKNFITSLFRGVILFKRWFMQSLILVGLPMFAYLPILLLQFKTSYLINNFSPESILLVTSLGIVVSSLVIDPLVIISTTFFYLSKTKK
ncbi:MAG: hypothetical protein ABIG56_03810 [Candidatus Omnitrophota bacterium]